MRKVERSAGEPVQTPAEGAAGPRSGLLKTAIWFTVATALSRIVGLAREAIAAGYFGISGAMSAFTLAFQIPNLVRALVADAALNSAFVPVFSQLLVEGRRAEAYRLASALAFVLAVGLGVGTALLVLFAPILVPLVAPGFSNELLDLTVDLAQVMFLIVPLMALSALTVAMLHTYGSFGAPAAIPIVWNVVVIGFIVGFAPTDPTAHGIRAYAAGVLAATVVQLLLPLPWLRGRGERLRLNPDWRNPHVTRVFLLMVPVTLSLGLVNFSLLVDSFFGTLVGDEIPAALDKAFRVMMVPQGLVPLALATILFPAMTRFVAAGELAPLRRLLDRGLVASLLMLLPSTVALIALAEPITRLLYQRGAFDAQDTRLVTEALMWWALVLPAQGMDVLLGRAFFSLQKPWPVAALSALNILVNIVAASLLYRPFGMPGIIVGTVLGMTVMTVIEVRVLNGLLPRSAEGASLATTLVKLLLAAIPQAVATWLALHGLERLIELGSVRDIVGILVVGPLGCVLFVVTAKMVGVSEAGELLARARRVLVGRRA